MLSHTMRGEDKEFTGKLLKLIEEHADEAGNHELALRLTDIGKLIEQAYNTPVWKAICRREIDYEAPGGLSEEEKQELANKLFQSQEFVEAADKLEEGAKRLITEFLEAKKSKR